MGRFRGTDTRKLKKTLLLAKKNNGEKVATPWPLGTPISVGNHFGATEKSNELFSLFR